VTERRTCSVCVLPEHPPDVVLDERGRCVPCAATRAAPASRDALLETDFLRLAAKHRGRGRYDCMVMCSGGQDSMAALWYTVERFGLRPLVYTFDNGFGLPGGQENVRRAVERLGVDWYLYHSEWMHPLFAEIVRSKAKVPICPVCSLWYWQRAYKVAKDHDIGLIITGYTKGQLEAEGGKRERQQLSFPSLGAATRAFLTRLRREHPRYARFPATMQEARRGARGIDLLSPLWFLPVHKAEYGETIRRELGWRPVEGSWPPGSVNCRLNFLAAWLSMRDWGFTHHHIEEAEMVRLGEVTREEALDQLRIDLEDPPTRAIILDVLERLGCEPADLGEPQRA
jgi:hypothetical protein